MIVVDSSALVAILFGEPERAKFQDTIARERCVMSAVNAHEAACVVRVRHGRMAPERLWRFIAENEIEVISFDLAQARAAAAAYGRYGKGIDPKTALNLCDCAAYALAKSMNAPLLFKGDDFTHTDLQSFV